MKKILSAFFITVLFLIMVSCTDGNHDETEDINSGDVVTAAPETLREQFEVLEIGMTYEQVREILVEDGEHIEAGDYNDALRSLSEDLLNQKTIMYYWGVRNYQDPEVYLLFNENILSVKYFECFYINELQDSEEEASEIFFQLNMDMKTDKVCSIMGADLISNWELQTSDKNESFYMINFPWGTEGHAQMILRFEHAGLIEKDTNGRVLGQMPIISVENWTKIYDGMTQEEVFGICGRGGQSHERRDGETDTAVYHYFLQETDAEKQAVIFTFENGILISREILEGDREMP